MKKKLQQEAGSCELELELGDMANKPALTGEWAGQQCARVKNPSRETPQNTAEHRHGHTAQCSCCPLPLATVSASVCCTILSNFV